MAHDGMSVILRDPEILGGVPSSSGQGFLCGISSTISRRVTLSARSSTTSPPSAVSRLPRTLANELPQHEADTGDIGCQSIRQDRHDRAGKAD